MHTSRSSRVTRLAARARDSVCPSTIANIVHAMSVDYDPDAVPALIELLDHQHDHMQSVERALLRYGEHVVDSLRAAVAPKPTQPAIRDAAERLLETLAYRARLLEVGCFESA